MYGAVNSAIRKRFATAYEDVRGLAAANPSLPKNTPTYTYTGTADPTNNCAPLKLFWAQGHRAVPILVFQENRDGQYNDITDTIEFQPVRTRYRDEDVPPGVDVDHLGTRTVILPSGKSVTGPELTRMRPGAIPESIYYDFRVESRSSDMASRLLELVNTLFPSRGYIDIDRLDGSIRTISVIRTTNFYRSSLFDATLEPGDPGLRKFQWTAQYQFESYTDNTVQGNWLPTILSRCTDVNLKEPQDN